MMKVLLTFFLRLASRNFSFTVINSAGLVMGFVVSIVLSSYLQWQLSYDSFHEDGNHIYRIVRSSGVDGYYSNKLLPVHPAPLAAAAKEQIPEIRNSARLMRSNAYVDKKGSDLVQLSGLAADTGFFSIFTWKWLHGSPAAYRQQGKHIVLTENTARKLFGRTDVVGERIPIRSYLDHGEFEITGVIENFPSNSHIQGDLIISFESFVSEYLPGDLTEWRNSNYYTYIQLNPGTSLPAVEAKLNEVFRTHRPDLAKEPERLPHHILQPLREIHFNLSTVFDFVPAVSKTKLWVIFTIAVTVLMLAAANYISMAIAQSIRRAKEIGIRKSSGAQAGNIIGQFMTETSLFCLMAFGIGFGLSVLLLPYFNYLLGSILTVDSLLKAMPVLLLTVCILIFIAGFYPAWVLSRYRPSKVLALRMATPEGSNRTLRDYLLITQFVIASVLVFSIAVFQSQLNLLLDEDPGFNREQILSVNMNNTEFFSKQDFIREELMKSPAIRSVSYSSGLPHNVLAQQGREWETPRGKIEVSFYSLYADERYVDLYGLTILEGQNFTSRGKTGVQEFLINETAARTYGWEDPVGMEFREGTDTIRIIGVVRDFHFQPKHTPIGSMRIGHVRDGWTSTINVSFAGKASKEAVNYIERTLKAVSDKFPIAYEYFDDTYAKAYEADRKSGEAIKFFTVLSLVIASLGLYGLVLFLVNSRVKEIGIRKAMGATWSSIAWLISAHFIKLMVISFVLASLPAYYIATTWLRGFAYRIEVSPLHFLLAFGVIIVCVALTLTAKLGSTSRINPAEVLRKE